MNAGRDVVRILRWIKITKYQMSVEMSAGIPGRGYKSIRHAKGWYTSALQHYYAAPQKTETDNLTTEIIKMSLHQEGEQLHSAIGK